MCSNSLHAFWNRFVNGYIVGGWQATHIPVLFACGGTGNSLCLNVGKNNERSVRGLLDKLCRHIEIKEAIHVQHMDCIRISSASASQAQEEKGDEDEEESVEVTYACSQCYWGVPAACGKTAESLRFFGGYRYDLSALYHILRKDSRNVRLTMWLEDGQTHRVDVDVSVLVVMKNKYFGKGLMICPLAKLDNGLLDVVVLPNVSRRYTLGLFSLIPHGTHILKTSPQKGPFYFRCSKIRIEPQDGCTEPGGVDGEQGPPSPMTIEVLPKAITMIHF